MIFFHINIKSICYKFDSLYSLISSHVYILSIVESKLDNSFSNAQFLIPNFRQLFRLDIIRNREGLLVFVRCSIPARMSFSYRRTPDIEAVSFEINLRKEKRLFVRVYKSPLLNNQYFCDFLTERLNFIQVFMKVSLFLVFSI